MQTALYRAERPEVFEDIIGQKHIVKILKNQLKTNSVSHAYLFAGTHGTGKTSTARILAKAVNCTGSNDNIPCGTCENCEAIREGRFPDCIELDAASNNGVEDLRAIVDMVKYPPALGKYKVYIIDEVHMLSSAAENAFLKTLEEPPEHAIFVLATTDPGKVRATIRSRCMELNFRRVSEDDLISGMRRICDKRNLNVTEEALSTIAIRANGSVRDALSTMEQCIASGDEVVDRRSVLEYTGAAGEDFFLALTDTVITGDAGKSLVYIDEILKRGKDARQILKDWVSHLRDLMVVKYVSKPEHILALSEENMERLRTQAAKISPDFIEKSVKLISEYINMGRYSERPGILLETAAVKLASENAKGTVPIAPIVPVRDAAESGLAESEETSSVVLHEGTNEKETITYEITDSPQEMWGRIVQEIAVRERSFINLVGNNSEAIEFDSGELKVSVKPGKIRFAEEKIKEITEAARRLYGGGMIISLKSGDLSDDMSKTREMTERETSAILRQDEAINETARELEDLFGIKPTIEN